MVQAYVVLYAKSPIVSVTRKLMLKVCRLTYFPPAD